MTTPDLRSFSELPRLVSDLPTTGGALREPEDFSVHEVPAYLPSGQGEHLYVLIEKRRLTTPQAIDRLCRHLGASTREAGYAGLKDREAVTRQWVSIAGAQARALSDFEDPQLEVLDISRHGNKLRTGHLRGNAFTLRYHGAVEDGPARAMAIMERITTAGMPNYYGPQRFGRYGDNAVVGLSALHGEGKLPRDRQRKRLIVSAAQSQIFNEVLAARLEAGLWGELCGGEVLQRLDSGGVFISEDRDVDQQRLEKRELIITGPICGPRMPRALAGSAAEAMEQAIFERLGVEPDAFSRFGRIARGGRRPLAIYPSDVKAEQEDDAFVLSFTLPAGSYATVLAREVIGDSTPDEAPA